MLWPLGYLKALVEGCKDSQWPKSPYGNRVAFYARKNCLKFGLKTMHELKMAVNIASSCL